MADDYQTCTSCLHRPTTVPFIFFTLVKLTYLEENTNVPKIKMKKLRTQEVKLSVVTEPVIVE